MESTEKLTDTNAILAYLYETFPLCFIAEGETKPLKIGLFQDLAERLADDSKVSKTQLRIAIRRYTNSWRYLKSLKEGVQRVDLDGNPCGELEAEHIEHAQQALKESQDKARARRQETAKAAGKGAREGEQKPRDNAKRKPRAKAEFAKKAGAKKPAAKKVEAPAVNLVQAELSQLSPGQKINVKLGATPVPGVISDINKEDIQVQLNTGLTVKVKAEHILL
ncbi:osmoprotectant transporter ProQ [Shewanella mangrovi]|uniref:RNA chaperone ProQ n=1 Tax=Shewanella mangrovi TaxID=1515746 RepID=A0A094K1R1_9GAMM|nr:RNA chaperone ProQ [Shewanella mangrovi]KFZ38601.1 osmoprotectant transporter ProQ [Shewanella mangrovi]